MIPFKIKKADKVKFKFQPLGDKSIAHRAIILSALSKGKTVIDNFPLNDDCLYTLKAFRKLGIKIILSKNRVGVFGKGLCGLKKPQSPIFLGNSGTSFRLLLGVLAGQPFKTVLAAAQGLSKRPMRRVVSPLTWMGAKIRGVRLPKKTDEYPPVTIFECKEGLHGFLEKECIPYLIPVASAQVKSAILFASLYTKKETFIKEKIKTRDHTERMLESFGADIKVSGNEISINPKKDLVSPGRIVVPGDISSAAFFMVLAAVCKNSEIIINNVGLNPTRARIINVLKSMNADIKIKNQRFEGKEPVGDIIVKTSKLIGTVITKEEIPSLIDELPILMVAACFAKGHTRFDDIAELRVKETDRIASMEYNLGKMGVKKNKHLFINSSSNNYESLWIEGPVKLTSSSELKSFGDHRTAMSMVIAGLAADGESKIDDIACINKSFPNFASIIKSCAHQ